jgi:carbon storage regulator
MLILSRRVGDAILVEGGIRIVIIACDRKGVRIGVEAPSDVSILREEIVTQIASENQRANATADLRDLLGIRNAGDSALDPALPLGTTRGPAAAKPVSGSRSEP